MPECLSAYTEVFLLGNQTHKIMFSRNNGRKDDSMAFFNSAVGVLQTLVIALGAGLGIWGIVNLLEGYGNDNPGAKSQGIKQLMAGGGVALAEIKVFDPLTFVVDVIYGQNHTSYRASQGLQRQPEVLPSAQ